MSTFKPAGVPGHALEQVTLSLDELEAARQADLEGLYQEEAAHRMEVSRQTFGNIVAAARRKLADRVGNGKLLRIQGGTVRLAGPRTFACDNCRRHWSLPSSPLLAARAGWQALHKRRPSEKHLALRDLHARPASPVPLPHSTR